MEIEDVGLKDSLTYEKSATKKPQQSKEVKSQIQFPEHAFNPNDLQVKDWQKMGFSEKQANVILNFKTSRGGFKTKEDLQSVFVIDDAFYNKIKPLIDLPTRDEFLSSYSKSYDEKKSSEETENRVVELNSATIEELKKLKGIGDYRAEQIIELRNKLGGYIEITQIKDIYNFPEEVFKDIKGQLKVDVTTIRKMDLNQVSYETLRDHPMISSLQAKSIIDLREQIGSYKSVDELIKTTHVDLRTYKELKGYFEVNVSNKE